jgi:hypothetical protein
MKIDMPDKLCEILMKNQVKLLWLTKLSNIIQWFPSSQTTHSARVASGKGSTLKRRTFQCNFDSSEERKWPLKSGSLSSGNCSTNVCPIG